MSDSGRGNVSLCYDVVQFTREIGTSMETICVGLSVICGVRFEIRGNWLVLGMGNLSGDIHKQSGLPGTVIVACRYQAI
jgi:hypothetical protein